MRDGARFGWRAPLPVGCSPSVHSHSPAQTAANCCRFGASGCWCLAHAHLRTAAAIRVRVCDHQQQVALITVRTRSHFTAGNRRPADCWPSAGHLGRVLDESLALAVESPVKTTSAAKTDNEPRCLSTSGLVECPNRMAPHTNAMEMNSGWLAGRRAELNALPRAALTCHLCKAQTNFSSRVARKVQKRPQREADQLDASRERHERANPRESQSQLVCG